MTLPSISGLCPRLFQPLILVVALFTLIVAGPAVAADAPADTTKHQFDLPAGEARPMLRAFAMQANHEIVFEVKNVDGVSTNAVKGEFTAREALDRLLMNTGLVGATDSKTGAFAVRKETPAEAKNGSRAARSGDRPSQNQSGEEKALVLETFEVMGKKLLNMDIPRSRDDIQPYMIFDRAALDNSGAASLEDFLRQRLTANSQGFSTSQFPGESSGSMSSNSINLRGLGANQTLILVDGHRVAGINNLGTPAQPDINGIPLAAIERIEVLPTTASGIYGGSATGGVINLVLRRNYAGTEVKLTYENTFDTDTAIRRVDVSSGFTFNHGRTNVMLAASYSTSNALLVQDRDFMDSGRRLRFLNNPALLLPTATPPLGATANIRSTTTNLQLKPAFGGTALNSLFTFVPYGYGGAATDQGAALVANAGKYNLDLADSAQAEGSRRSLLNAPELESINATIRHQFSPRVQGFLEAAASNTTGHYFSNPASGTFTLAATAPNNPFVQAIQVRVPLPAQDSDLLTRSYNRRVVGGIIVQLPGGWKAEADYTWNLMRLLPQGPKGILSTGTAAITSGTLDILRDTSKYPIDLSSYLLLPSNTSYLQPWRSILRDATVRASGEVFHLPAGAATVSTSLEHRDEYLADVTLLQAGTSPISSYFPSRSQAIDSLYAELRLPVFADGGPIGLRDLEFQLAARHDDYTVKGVTGSIIDAPSLGLIAANQPLIRTTTKAHSTNPTVGFKFAPVKSAVVRASYGTGFLAPTVNQIVPGAPVSGVSGASLVDPLRGNTAVGTYTSTSNGNRNLRPEKSETWSAGIIITPRALPEFRISLDYTRIKKRDNIAAFPGGVQGLINNESLFPGRITRGASLPGDQPGWAGPITAIDGGNFNLFRSEVEAYDLAIDYRHETAAVGLFEFFAAGTLESHYKTQTLLGQPLVENVGYSFTNPLKFKANGGITWRKNHWSVTWTTRYFDSYLVYQPTLTPAQVASAILTQGQGGRIPSQVYHDVFLSYRVSAGGGPKLLSHWLGNTEIQVGVKNVFNKEPPFDSNTVFTGASYYSTFGDPRLATYQLSFKKTF